MSNEEKAIKDRILGALAGCGIAELGGVRELSELPGSYVNLEARLPNGTVAKILDDGKVYYCCQAERTGSDRCYGAAADSEQLAVYRYGCGGADAEIVLWTKL